MRCIGHQWSLTSEPRVCLFDGHPSRGGGKEPRTDTHTDPVRGRLQRGPTARLASARRDAVVRAAPRQSFVTEFTVDVSLRREGTDARAGPRYEWVGALSVAPGLREERWGHIRADRARGKDVRGPACMWGRRLVRVKRGVGVALCWVEGERIDCFYEKQPPTRTEPVRSAVTPVGAPPPAWRAACSREPS